MAKTKIKAKAKAKAKVPKSKAKDTSTTKNKTKATTTKIIPQGRAKLTDLPLQCWAHSQTGNRCKIKVPNREGEPIPIPYCDKHLKSGDGALRVVTHPLFGKALVARYDLPANYRMAYWGIRGKCASCDVEDVSFLVRLMCVLFFLSSFHVQKLTCIHSFIHSFLLISYIP